MPQRFYAALGVKEVDVDKMDRLRERLAAVSGVRAAIIDPGRWFTNEQGLDVGGAVIFTDPDPRLEKHLVLAAAQVGFPLDPHRDALAAMPEKERSGMSHRITGLPL